MLYEKIKTKREESAFTFIGAGLRMFGDVLITLADMLEYRIDEREVKQ